MAQQPAFVVVYGAAGKGKSVDAIYSWAGSALYLAQPGALRGAESVIGHSIDSQVVPCSRLAEAAPYLQMAKDNGFGAVVVDDISLLMRNEMEAAKPTYAIFDKIEKGKISGYDRAIWGYYRQIVTDFSARARWLGINVIANAHEQVPFVDDKTGERFLGGPDLGWAKLVKDIPHAVDLLLRVQSRGPTTPAWDTVADCDPTDRDWQMKDRFAKAIPRGGPLNTAEILRAANYTIPRPAGMEWAEAVAEQVAVAILSGTPEKQASGPVKAELVKQGCPPYLARWALRDGVHRGRLRLRAQQSVLEGF
jgi:hypothetical protein